MLHQHRIAVEEINRWIAAGAGADAAGMRTVMPLAIGGGERRSAETIIRRIAIGYGERSCVQNRAGQHGARPKKMASARSAEIKCRLDKNMRINILEKGR